MRLLLPLLFLASCVTPGRVEALVAREANEVRLEAEEALRDLQAGLIGPEEFSRRLDLVAQDAQTRARVEAQAAAMEQMQGLPSDPVELLLWLLGTAGVAGAGVNTYRDRRRKARGEMV